MTNEPTVPNHDDYDYASSAERVTDERRIAHMLKGLMDSRALLTVSVPDHSDACNSVIFHIDPEQGILYLDELTPQSGHEKLLAVGRAGIHAMLHGVHTYFRASLASHGEENGIAYYRVPYPDVLFYEQKREHYRVYIGLSQRLPVDIRENFRDGVMSGRLYDLSVGGVGIRFPADVSLTEGEVLPNCRIELPGEGRLDCSLEIRHVHHDPAHNEIHVGARFINLQGLQQRAIQRCVQAFEREAIRKQTRG